MPITVEGPGGTKIEFPDDTSPDVIQRESRRVFGGVAPSTGPLESFGRGLVDGATFGFDGKVLGEDWRKAREKSRDDNPWTHFAGEMIGGVAPLLALGPAGPVARGAVAARRVGALTTEGAQAVRTAADVAGRVFNPAMSNSVMGAVSAGARAGAAGGALSGIGHSTAPENGPDETALDTATRYVKDAGIGAGVGAAGGAVVGPVVHGAVRVGQNVAARRAAVREEMSSPEAGGVRAIARNLERDNLSPEALQASIRGTLPPTGGRFGSGANAGRWSDELVESVADIAHRNPDASAAEVRQLLAAAMPGQPVPGRDAIATFLTRFHSRETGPLNLVDHASMASGPGGGDNTQWLMRAAAATPGEARDVTRRALVERQLSAGDRVANSIERNVGSLDMEGELSRHQGRVDAAANRMYAEAMRNEQPFDLEPIIRDTYARFDGRRGPVPEGMMRAADSMLSDRPVPPSRLETVGLASGGNIVPHDVPGIQTLPIDERRMYLEGWRSAREPVRDGAGNIVRRRQIEGLADFVRSYVSRNSRGGRRLTINDPSGHLMSVGDDRFRAMSRPSGGAVSIDDIALAAQDAGFVGRPTNSQTSNNPRVTVDEFVDALARDLDGDPVVRPEDYDLLDAFQHRQQYLNDLAESGLSARTEREALEQLGFVRAPREGFTTEKAPPANLREFIDARANVRQLKETEQNARPRGSQAGPLERELTSFYAEITDAVASTNPAWARANALVRDGKLGEEALRRGASLATRLNEASRESLDEVRSAWRLANGETFDMVNGRRVPRQATPDETAVGQAQVALFRVGFARSLIDRIVNNKRPGHDLVGELMSPGARQIISTVLGPEDARRFLQFVDAEAAMNRTYRSLYGSQTTPLREAIDDLNFAPRFQSALDYLRPGKILDAAMEYTAARYNARRNEALSPMLVDTNPIAQLRTLRAVGNITDARSDVAQGRISRAGRALVGSTANTLEGVDHGSRR